MISKRPQAGVLPVLLLLLLLPAAPARAFEPTADYEKRDIEGWTVRVSGKLLAEHRDVADEALALLRVKLFDANRALPPAALARLRADVAVWVEWADERFPGMCFHPSAGWLRENGYNPDKAGGIEIGNVRNFLKWSTDQPSMVVHELAHAYHHKVLGANHAELRAAFDAAREGGKYDRVLRAGGGEERAYAMNNASEFFAELSESYFGTNDFFPFVRAELRRHDRESYELVRRLWGAGDSRREAVTREAGRGAVRR